MTRSINRRINDLHRSGEDLIRIDLGGQRQFHALFEFREITLGDSYECFELVDLRQYHDRLTAVQLTVLIVLGTDHARERSLVVRVDLEEVQLLLGRVILRLDLVVLLLRSRTRLEQLRNTVLLRLEVGEADLRCLVLRLVHRHQRLTLRHFVTHFHEDMLYLTRYGRSYVDRQVALQVSRYRYLALYLTRLEHRRAHLFHALLLFGRCFLLAACHHRNHSQRINNSFFHIDVHY